MPGLAAWSWEFLEVVIFAVVFELMNGLHDVSNAIATIVGSKVWPYRKAARISAFANLLGALAAYFSGQQVAKVIGTNVVYADKMTLKAVAVALLFAFVWGAITAWKGIPSSSTHALLGALAGAALATSGFEGVNLWGFVEIFGTLLASPFVGYFIAMRFIRHSDRRWADSPETDRIFSRWQKYSAFAVSVAHGMNDSQKTIGALALACGIVRGTPAASMTMPLWIVFVSGCLIAAGTLSRFGVRITDTMGSKIMEMNPRHGFVAETSAAVLIVIGTVFFHWPLSTTHCSNGAIYGTGRGGNLHVCYKPAADMLVAWILTIPAAGVLAYMGVKLLS